MNLSAYQVRVERQGLTILSVDQLSLRPGELVVVVGPNGAGKSTLMSLLSGDCQPSDGEVCLNARPLDDFHPAELACHRAAIGAPPSLAFDFTVQDVVALGWLHGKTIHNREFFNALKTVLEQCELAGLAERKYMTLSSGERQRVQYARACLQLWPVLDIQGPRWLLLDEPTANMDVAHAVHLLDALRQRTARGDGVVVVLHDLDLAARYADRVLLVCSGKLIAAGQPETVMTSDVLSDAYQTPIHVEHHPTLQRLVVIG